MKRKRQLLSENNQIVERKRFKLGGGNDTTEELWFNMFVDYEVRSIFQTPERFKKKIQSPENIDCCIINNPLETLSLTLIDFDAEKEADELLKISKLSGNDRGKSVFATVRGSGGGKTRSLEEIQRVLLLREGVFSIAITFNNIWTYEHAEENWIESKVRSRKLYYVLSVIARMASVVFKIGFRDVIRMFHRELHLLPDFYQSYPDKLIRYFLRYIIERILPKRDDIHTLILLMDEVMAIENGLDNIFIESPSKDTGSVLRSAFLDKNLILRKKSKIINLALAVSTLDAAALGKSSCGRGIKRINLPSKLNVTKVINKLLGMKNCKDIVLKLLLKSLVSTVNMNPRLIEYLVTFLRRNNLNSNSDRSFLNSIVINNCFKELNEKISEKYGQQQASERVLSAIVFGGKLRLNKEDTLESIECSVISNPLESFNVKKDSIEKVESSIMMLWNAVKGKDIMDCPIAYYIERGIVSITNKLVNWVNEGDLLEVIIYEWLKIRIITSIYFKSDIALTLLRLLALPTNENVFPIDKKTLFTTPLNIFNMSTLNLEYQILYDSHDNPSKFRKEIDKIKVSAINNIVLIRPHAKESFDVGLVLFDPNSGQPFYIFIDVKSVRERDTLPSNNLNNNNISMDNFPGKGSRFNHTKNMMQNREFVYHYMNNKMEQSFMIDNVVNFGRENILRFIGSSLNDLYICVEKLIKNK